MQNVQYLTGTGGCSKNVFKYISKIYKQNYVVVSVDGEGNLVTNTTFLHNTKTTTSKMCVDKNREKHRKNPQVICISHMEMLHVMLKYPEVVTNLDFIKFSTMTLDLRLGIKVNSDTDTEDFAYVVSEVESFRRSINLDNFRLHT